jgi:hypothetical protein
LLHAISYSRSDDNVEEPRAALTTRKDFACP